MKAVSDDIPTLGSSARVGNGDVQRECALKPERQGDVP